MSEDQVLGALSNRLRHLLVESRDKPTMVECSVSIPREPAKDDEGTLKAVVAQLSGLIQRERFVPSVNMTADRAAIVLTRALDVRS